MDDEEFGEESALAFFCPECSEAECGRARQNVTGCRWRDGHKPNPATFRVALDTAIALMVADAELVTVFDVVEAAGGSVVSVTRGGGGGPTRLELELAAQNDGHARRLAIELVHALGGVAPSVPSGWVFASMRPA